MSGESIELPLPESSVALDPILGFHEWVGSQTAAMHPSFLGSGKKARAFEDPQMFRDRGERDIEWAGQLGYRRLSLSEPGEDGPPRRVRQSGKGCIKRSLRIVNHMVNYCPLRCPCQARNAAQSEEKYEPPRRQGRQGYGVSDSSEKNRNPSSWGVRGLSSHTEVGRSGLGVPGTRRRWVSMAVSILGSRCSSLTGPELETGSSCGLHRNAANRNSQRGVQAHVVETYCGRLVCLRRGQSALR